MTPRRLASLLVIWISLFSMAVPAIACAEVTQRSDCCPDQETPPCGQCPEQSPSHGASLDQCLAATGSVATMGAVAEPTRTFDAPDFQPAVIYAAALETRSLTDSTEPVQHRWRAPREEFETPTYLITGRLRL